MVKKFYLIFGIVMLFVIVSSTNALALNIDSCQDLQNVSGTVFTLTQNIIADSTTCFTFQNNSLTLDCQGNTVQVSSNTNTGIGIRISAKNHIFIQGCRFLGNGTIRSTTAIYSTTPRNMTIFNNSFLSQNGTFSTVIDVDGSEIESNSTIRNNIFHLLDDTSLAAQLIDVGGMSNTTISYNNMTTRVGSTSGAISLGGQSGTKMNDTSIMNNNITVFRVSGVVSAIEIGVSNWNVNFSIENNNITVNGTAGGTTGAYGIDGLGRSTKIRNNHINVSGGGSMRGIRGNTDNFFDYFDSIIENNIIESKSVGIELTAGTNQNNDNKVRNNTIKVADTGIVLSGITNSFIINNTISAIGSVTNGIQSLNNFRNNTIINNTIGRLGGSFTYGFQLGSGGDQENNTVYNNFFNASFAGIYINSITGDFNNLSITKTTGTNIVGGSNLGGNFYPRAALSSETNYAYSCMDSDADGICDIALSFGSNSYDFYPLASVNDVPVFRNNGTSNSAPKVNEGINISANFTDDLELDTITLEHNASGGVLVNTSAKASGVSVLNVSFNLTVSALKNQAVAYKFYVNDTRGRTNSSPQAFFTVANTEPTLTHQSQFVNLTQHSFNVSATFNDTDGTSDFVNRSITFTSGTCNYLGNKTVGSTGLNLTFNCTGTFPNTNSIVISVNDSSLSAISTTSASNVYPNTLPATPIITPSALTNKTTNSQALTCEGGDVDNDTLSYEFYADKNNPPTTLRQNISGDSSYTLTFDSTGNWYFRCRSHDAYDAGSYSAITEFYVDFIAPSFLNIQNNASSVKMHDNVSFGANISDDLGLSFGRVAHNLSGGFVNGSLKQFSGTTGFINTSVLNNRSKNVNVCFMVWANDTLNNGNTTTSCFTTANNIPVVISNDGSQNRPSINNTPITTQSANVSWNFADLDNDTITNFGISWFINGNRIAKAENSRYLTADNFTTDDIIIAGVNISDGFSSSTTVNTTNVTIGDGTPPLILDNFTIPTSVVRDNTIALYVNVTDVKSGISTVTFVVTTPNNVATSHTGTLNSGSSEAGQVSRWTATFTTTTTGTHQVNVTVTDSSSNVARSVQGFLNFTVDPPTSPGSPGGGGGGTDTETIIIEKEAFVGCGDSVCSNGENPSNCFQDCPINVDNLVTCLFSGKECAYSQAWFAQVLIYGLVAGGAYIAIAANKKAKFKSTE